MHGVISTALTLVVAVCRTRLVRALSDGCPAGHAYEVGVDYYGSDCGCIPGSKNGKGKYVDSIDSAAACATLCSSTRQASYFTYRASDGRCWCKTHTAGRRALAGMTSGLAACALDEAAEQQAVESTREAALRGLSDCARHFRRGTGAVVVVTLLDVSYLEFAEPWQQRLRHLGLRNRVLITLDSQSTAVLSREASAEGAGNRSCLVSYASPRGDYSDRIPKLTGLAKFDVLAALGRLGWTTLLSEADVYWFRSPIRRITMNSPPLVGAKTKYTADGINLGPSPLRRMSPPVKHVLGQMSS
eukprot:TRINITY_DN39815_c0_g1_i2.p1 TRINITY_DN39815_c0_g1~~TRINITY_DN39815_c0_g1_i2.p1  ORF type:complete len:301 (-),score=42.04 TRINITY_DN39815_c0_g1_i2:69-971(-)